MFGSFFMRYVSSMQQNPLFQRFGIYTDSIAACLIQLAKLRNIKKNKRLSYTVPSLTLMNAPLPSEELFERKLGKKNYPKVDFLRPPDVTDVRKE